MRVKAGVGIYLGRSAPAITRCGCRLPTASQYARWRCSRVQKEERSIKYRLISLGRTSPSDLFSWRGPTATAAWPLGMAITRLRTVLRPVRCRRLTEPSPYRSASHGLAGPASAGARASDRRKSAVPSRTGRLPRRHRSLPGHTGECASPFSWLSAAAADAKRTSRMPGCKRTREEVRCFVSRRRPTL